MIQAIFDKKKCPRRAVVPNENIFQKGLILWRENMSCLQQFLVQFLANQQIFHF